MEKLGLQITRPYHDLYSFDARKIRCLGMIKDLVVHLAQIPVKSVLMDIVVADVPVNYRMLLSRSWENKLGGFLQMDMMYATILVFGGETRKIYRETKPAYTISDHKHPNNYPIYLKDQDLGCFTLSVNDELENCTEAVNIYLNENKPKEEMWKMYFDGSSSWEGDGAGILLISPFGKKFPFYFRLQFETDSMNNVCEYEDLVLGLEVSKKMKIVNLIVYGDA